MQIFVFFQKHLSLNKRKSTITFKKLELKREGTTTFTTITTTASTAALLIDIICTQEGMKYEF